ncbi:YqzK family protein [Virgibacillus alimentarius]|uniref:DUF4227 domain-containing protein n=1 Tax=Virgibacillus alimentarius TaxID=698769 RepID=A0ABS4S4V2_9BACI|nr:MULTISPECIES: YqzK family protein [Virgibacillus]MBP2256434.1 hypothetical protein [Virgibacillus alimentarius]HLR66379.1 YqzK family protein [Virgibacillus sp.]
MKRLIWDAGKVFIIFIACTFLFYFGLRVMHTEYEQFHRYDEPEGPAVKVFNTEDSIVDRLHLFFRLGE